YWRISSTAAVGRCGKDGTPAHLLSTATGRPCCCQGTERAGGRDAQPTARQTSNQIRRADRVSGFLLANRQTRAGDACAGQCCTAQQRKVSLRFHAQAGRTSDRAGTIGGSGNDVEKALRRESGQPGCV